MSCHGADFCLTIQQQSPIFLDATLSCNGGQLLALVGPSGSGKSTLLRMIAGLSWPAAGQIICGDSCWYDQAQGIWRSPQQRHVGFVPQHYGLFPHMTALANVLAGLHHLPDHKREPCAREWLARVHLAGLEQRRPAELSGGQQQRVALARALAREPSMLLLDEPFAAVDRATRETLYIELAELKRELSLPIIMVTHDLGEALLLADRMTLLSHGKTLQSGQPREILARPVNEAAARLLGIRNLFDGELLRHDEQAGLTWFRSGDHLLACRLDARWAPGSRVRWMAPNSAIRLRAAGQGSLPASHNQLRITVRGVLELGDEVRITAAFAGQELPLHLLVPFRLAQKLDLRVGSATDVVLIEEGLHLLN
ncbi:MAG: ABC transporter ATP-binding protein [Geobacter sp.]